MPLVNLAYLACSFDISPTMVPAKAVYSELQVEHIVKRPVMRKHLVFRPFARRPPSSGGRSGGVCREKPALDSAAGAFTRFTGGPL
jgi:hypothetical protein